MAPSSCGCSLRIQICICIGFVLILTFVFTFPFAFGFAFAVAFTLLTFTCVCRADCQKDCLELLDCVLDIPPNVYLSENLRLLLDICNPGCYVRVICM